MSDRKIKAIIKRADEPIGAKMTIRNWNGDVVVMDKWWKYAYAGDTEERLKQAIDDMIRLGPFLGASWWSEVTA